MWLICKLRIVTFCSSNTPSIPARFSIFEPLTCFWHIRLFFLQIDSYYRKPPCNTAHIFKHTNNFQGAGCTKNDVQRHLLQNTTVNGKKTIHNPACLTQNVNSTKLTEPNKETYSYEHGKNCCCPTFWSCHHVRPLRHVKIHADRHQRKAISCNTFLRCWLFYCDMSCHRQ